MERYRILWQTQKFCFEHVKVEEPKKIQVEMLARQFDKNKNKTKNNPLELRRTLR